MKLTTIVFLFMIAISISVSAQSSKDASAIRKVMEDQTTAWNKGDLETFMAGYWKSEKLKFVSGDKITYGWQQTLDNYKKTYGGKGQMGTLTFSELDITLLAKDAAYVVGSWHLKREKDDPRGKFTLLWRKVAGEWLIVSDHSS